MRGRMTPLCTEQNTWIETTLNSLSLEERVGQLLLPMCANADHYENIKKLLPEIRLGGVFVFGARPEEHRERLRTLQGMSCVPLVVAADLEAGAGHVVQGGVPFPDPLAVAAADRDDLAWQMGRAAALQGRSVGIHWTFAPVVDVNINPDNPIANTRSLGDDPERISRLAAAIIQGAQEHGLATCAKHFPGDGIDDFDQHVVTSVNSLSMEDWKRISGRTFSAAFAADVMSVMIGHIALPAWDPTTDRRGAYCPASVNKRIVTDLLRKEMGFEGLIVTDDMNMGGVSGYMNSVDRTIGCINAGCDMLLFPQLPGDYHTLLAAVKDGRISEERLNDAVRRILEFKTRLNLNEGQLEYDEPSPLQAKEFAKAARQIAEGALVKVRDVDGLLPLKDLKPGARVATVTLSIEPMELPEVDAALKARGFQVDHFYNPGFDFAQNVKGYDAVFVNFAYKASWAVTSVRSVGVQNRMFMFGFYMEQPRTVFTSFGSPYHLRQFSALPNLINAHSSSDDSQRAAVAAWFGDLPMNGKSPVGNLVRKF
jgi:beta-N-acetylhexosaminidase